MYMDAGNESNSEGERGVESMELKHNGDNHDCAGWKIPAVYVLKDCGSYLAKEQPEVEMQPYVRCVH